MTEPDELEALLDKNYCPVCKHPWSYHGEDGCSMPVEPGTHLPYLGGSSSRERCGCTKTQD